MVKDLSKRLYVQNPEEWTQSLRRKRIFDDELEVKIVERGIVLPVRPIEGVRGLYLGGVCDSNLKFVAGYYRQKGGGGSKQFNCMESAYEVDSAEIVQFDEDVIFGGFIASHFGHFLMECLCRLWYVIEHPEIKSKVLFVTAKKSDKRRLYNTEIFGLMGIDKARIVFVDKPVQCRSITVPEQAQYDSKRITKEFLLPYIAMKSTIKPGEHKKLYLTRSGFEFKEHGNSHIFNEKYFEDFFAARGFKVVSMEKLKVSEQISLIMGADEIAATLGTLTHWAMFCKPDTKFIMLRRISNSTIPLQSLINVLSKVDYYIVDVSRNFMYANRALGVLLLGANKHWKNFVADYFGERITEDDGNAYFKEALNTYIDFWYKKYSVEEPERITESFKDMCNRIIYLERALRAGRPLLTYVTRVSSKGWGTWKSENTGSNAVDKLRELQSIKIKFTKPFHDVYYSVHYSDKKAWTEEVSTSQVVGAVVKGRFITGIKIRLDDSGADKFDILYRVHKFDGEWTPWAKNGAELFADGAKLNSVQIKLANKAPN